MKKIIKSFLVLLVLIGIFTGLNTSAKADEEVRGVWISSVFNIDWPSKSSYGNVGKQKQELVHMLDKFRAAGINTVYLQVRPESDSLYNSSINPWSRYLTGVQGKNPGYDPLDFAVREAHSRGMKIHAWLNPYRASIYNDISSTSVDNYINLHRDWVVHFNNKWYYDPGLPEVRNYIVETVSEIVRNYDIDGIHFDDYFYPGVNFDDSKSFAKYGNGSIHSWRRNNVNTMVSDVNSAIKSIKQNIEFGISPAGIWRNKKNDVNGSNTSGGESYSSHYADSRYWIKNGLIDYIAPQVYWRIGHPKADYETLVRWWSDQVRGTNVKLYIGQALYKRGQAEYAGENVAAEIKNQIAINRKYSGVSGSIYFSARDLLNHSQIYSDVKSINSAVSSSDISINDETIIKDDSTPDKSKSRLPYKNEMMGADRAETAIKISQKSWKNGTDTVVLVNGKELLNAVSSSPLASSLNAPILLSFAGKVSDNTIKEIKRLNAKKVIIVGDKNAIKDSDIVNIKNFNKNISIERINSSNPQMVSLKVAKLLSKKTIDTVYIASENALVDVLSISSKAGNKKSPILISSKNKLSEESIDFIRKNKIKNIFFIGGPNVLSNSVISQVSNSIGINLSGNRIFGRDRIETNTKVIEQFYENRFTDKAFITRSDAPIDAITVSVFAQKTDSPIILAGKSVPTYQKNVLQPRSASLVYKVGGGVNQNTYNTIYNLLGGKMK